MTRLAPPHPSGTRWVGLGGDRSLLLPRRTVRITALLLLACVVLAVIAIGVGASSYGYADAWRLLLGEEDRGAHLVIVEWRGSRIVLALVVGAALGVSGALFQSVTRNPLGSPDLIGFSMGAQTGILVAVLLFGASYASVSAASLVGGIAVGAVIYALSLRSGFGGLVLILSGIAISAMLGAFNRWLLVRADSDAAFGALRAVTGTLEASDWSVAIPTAICVLVVLGATLALAPAMRDLELGPDLAASLGLRVERTRALMVLAGTVLVALATTAVGPIMFVALIAPHLARRLARDSVASLPASAATGALLLLGADVLSQAALDSMPVGIVTAAVGGTYFMALLLLENRRTS
ncbi:FecCD family ABC transporter permease [Leucobacter iarius]|uniref:Iron-enterobactin ABC transporter permease n=1 Tax=Leucobacter iarius TaxID=333963 RepID=A0ABP4XRK3_9MICO